MIPIFARAVQSGMSLVCALTLAAAPTFAGRYRGTIGTYPVAMVLMQRGATLEGGYRYVRRKEDLMIEGKASADGTFTLREFWQWWVHSGTFRGSRQRDGSLRGTFVRLSDGRTFPFRLNPERPRRR